MPRKPRPHLPRWHVSRDPARQRPALADLPGAGGNGAAADKAYDTADFMADCRPITVTPQWPRTSPTPRC